MKLFFLLAFNYISYICDRDLLFLLQDEQRKYLFKREKAFLVKIDEIMNLYLSQSSDLYIVDLDRIVYFEADDHYVNAYYDSNMHFMLPFGLSFVEDAIKSLNSENSFLVRLGRKHIINVKRLFHINMLKQELMLVNEHAKFHILHVSKPALHELMERIKNYRQEASVKIIEEKPE